MGLKEFTQQYMVTALWSSSDNSDDQGSEHLDANYDVSDIAPESRKVMEADCKAFYETHNALWSDDSTAGHDFWLTRNGHGAGFWDGDYEEPQATTLTDASEVFGNVDLYVGDDGLIYQAGTETPSNLKTAEPGTVSEGTLKAEDLLPKFADALEWLIQDNAEHWCGRQEQRDAFVNLVWVLRECDFDHDDVEQYLEDACEALSYFAPAGYSFGTHEGDGADFGFWPCEDN